MGRLSGGYSGRFKHWECWAAVAAVLIDVVSFVIPLFALAFLVVLLHPHGWRWMARLTDVLRHMQES